MTIRYRIIGAFALGSIAFSALAQQDNEDDPLAGEQHHDEHHYIDEVVVSAAPLERTVEQMAQPISVLSGDALARSHSSSIGETLADQPGVSATYFGPVASRPVIRGQFGERVLVLTNGLASLDASALSEDHAVSIDSILAQRIEVVRGPATLLYGSGAAGGLVNVVDSRIPERPLQAPLSGKFALGADSATSKREGAGTIDFGSEQIAGHLDYFRRSTSDVEIPGFAESARLRALEEEEGHEDHEGEEASGVLENTDSDIEGGAGSVTFTGERYFAGLTLSRYNSDYGIPGHHHDEEEGGEEEDVRIALDQTRYDLSAGFEFDGFFSGARLRIGRNEYTHKELEGEQVGTMYDNLGADSRLELKHRALGIFEGALGAQYKRTDFNAVGDEAFVPPSDTRQTSIFIFEEASISESWVLQASARAENQRIDAPQLPRYDETTTGASIGAIWTVSEAATLSANLALTERHPNSTELFADGPHVAVQRVERGSVTLGRGILGKEVSTNLDLTLRGSLGPLEYNLTGFINDVNDYILLSPTADEEDGLQVFNYGQADVEMYGYEGELLFDVFENDGNHLHARVFSDFVYGEEKVSGAYLPRLPPLRYGVGMHYVREKIEASVDVTHTTDQTRTAANELATDSFTMIDFEATYFFDRPNLMVFVRGTNLGNEDARRHSSPLKDIAPLPGRSLHLGLRLDF
jgi:iron complex outermembrane receptor protein